MTGGRRSRLGVGMTRNLVWMTRIKIVIPACTTFVIPTCLHLRHPRMLLSGDLLNRLFQRSQTVWEIPDRYFVSSGMTGGDPGSGAGMTRNLVWMTRIKIVIPACHLPRHSRMRQLRHPRMLLSGDLLNRLFQRSQTV
jgi:hypothetical protein